MDGRYVAEEHGTEMTILNEYIELSILNGMCAGLEVGTAFGVLYPHPHLQPQSIHLSIHHPLTHIINRTSHTPHCHRPP